MIHYNKKNMFNTKKIVFVLSFLGCHLLFAQSIDKAFYWENIATYNPAYYGTKSNFSAIFQSSIATSDEFKPSYSLVNVDARVLNNFGVGATLNSESYGGYKSTYFYGGFSYKLNTGDMLEVSSGMSLGYSNASFSSLDYSTNPYVDQTDPFLQSGGWSKNEFVVGAGIYIKSRRVEAGISAPTLLRDGGKLSSSTNLFVNSMFYVSKNLVLVPMVFVNTDVQKKYLLADFSAMLEWGDVEVANGFSLTLGYNTKNELSIVPGFRRSYFNFSYSFKNSIGDNKEVNQFKHEVIVGFSLGRLNFRQVNLREKYGHKKGKS